jgi:4-hydroxybenzoate polyprenyltransferase
MKHQFWRRILIKEGLALSRPFTLLPPMLGVVSGALTAWGSRHSPWQQVTTDQVALVALAAFAAALLNAASNALNQITDLNIDRLNKPHRVLPSGQMSLRAAWRWTLCFYGLSLVAVYPVIPEPEWTWTQRWLAPWWQHHTFWLYAVAALFTLVYSLESFGRTKRLTFGANVTIAIPRGWLLKVAGWSVLGPISVIEPWLIGLCFFLFLLGAASTKDFSDMRGDQAGGCRTLPLVFGVKKAAWMIAPFFVVPWLVIPVCLAPLLWGKPAWLSGNPLALFLFGLTLTVWGLYTAWTLLKDPDALSAQENHPSWRHMYLMMLWAQIGFALAYLR